MEYEFRMQDPTTQDAVYLFEAIIDAVDSAEGCRGVFSFVSRDGVDALLLDVAVTNFLTRGDFYLIVGVDAITDRATLERLQELEDHYSRLRVRVFWNRTAALFHPKIAHFRYGDGRQTVIVGSGNLTPGGLRENFEAYLVLRTGRRERLDISPLDRFLSRHARDIRPIDEEVLERAARNVMRGGRRRGRDVEREAGVEEEVPSDREEEGRQRASTRMLVAQIPSGGGRWHQAHFNKAVADRFFQIKAHSAQRVFLRERQSDGSLGSLEVRPLVLGVNKNRRIELAARVGVDYPTGSNPPIGVFREIHVRTFEYMLLMPGDPGYPQMLRFTQTRRGVGGGFPRVITDVRTVRRAWPACPLC